MSASTPDNHRDAFDFVAKICGADSRRPFAGPDIGPANDPKEAVERFRIDALPRPLLSAPHARKSRASLHVGASGR